jgi:hypothetical protein
MTSIALADARVYWTFGLRIYDGGQRQDGAVMSVPVSGGEPTVVASEQYVPSALALGDSDVFWFDELTRWIMKAPKTGGAPTQVAASSSVYRLIVKDDSVFWLGHGDDGPGVFTAPVDGGAAVKLAAVLGTPGAMALDETHLYWSDFDLAGSRVVKVPIHGGEPAVLYSMQATAQFVDLAVGPSGVYWNGAYGEGSNENGFADIKLLRIPLSGGEPVTLAEEAGIDRLALNSTHLYWTIGFADGSEGAVRRLALDSGIVTTVASGELGVSELAVDDADVCWLDNRIGISCRKTCNDDC